MRSLSRGRGRRQVAERLASELPYGVWILADGAAVLHNRHYQAIAARSSAGHPAYVRPNRYVPWAEQIALYEDRPGSTPWDSPRIEGRLEKFLDGFLAGQPLDRLLARTPHSDASWVVYGPHPERWSR